LVDVGLVDDVVGVVMVDDVASVVVDVQPPRRRMLPNNHLPRHRFVMRCSLPDE
jgi:hypothetical protein